MKKIFLIGLGATAMLASCSNDETVEMAQNTKTIGFSSFIDKSTRATDTDITNLGAIEVYGWRGNDQIFDAQSVTVEGDGSGTYSPLQYWEANKTYSFEAIAPKNGEKGVTFAAAKTGGTITFENDAETDLLYAGVVEKTTKNIETESDVEKVHFTFGHLLSRVKFTFKNGFPENAAAKITVTGVKITNAYKNGTITPAVTNAAWDVANSTTFAVSFASETVKDLVAGTGSESTDHMYLIPANSPSYTVEFTVTLDQNGVTSTYSHTTTITTSMAKGNSYNFIATLDNTNVDPENTMYPIEFEAEVSPWNNQPDVDLDL